MKLNILLKAAKNRLWTDGESILLVRPANKEVPGYPAQFDGELKEVTYDNVEDCSAFEDASVYVPAYRRFIENGDYVLFGYLNGKCVYRNVATFSNDLLYGHCLIRKITGEGQEGIVTYNYCAPEARGHGFGKASIINIFNKYYNTTFYGLIAPDNIPAMKNAVSCGFEIKSRLTFRTRFFRYHCTEKILSEEEIKNCYRFVQ